MDMATDEDDIAAPCPPPASCPAVDSAAAGDAAIDKHRPKFTHSQYHRRRRRGLLGPDCSEGRPLRKRQQKNVATKRLADLDVAQVSPVPAVAVPHPPAQKVAGSRRRTVRGPRLEDSPKEASPSSSSAPPPTSSTHSPTPVLASLPVTTPGYIAKRLPQSEIDILDSQLGPDELVRERGFRLER